MSDSTLAERAPEQAVKALPAAPRPVLNVEALPAAALATLFAHWDIPVRWCQPDEDIPGTFWGDREAGIVRGTLWVRGDTPVHSALHEGGHLVCMEPERRAGATRDAGGSNAEECAVCYLSVLMADVLAGYDRRRMLGDMDEWGYSFRLGSAQEWFENDAEDAREWLLKRRIISADKATAGETIR